MSSMQSVWKKVYERSYKEGIIKTPEFNEDVKKKYRDYFKEIAELLYVNKNLEKLRNKRKQYVFGEDGALKLEELILHYERSKMRKSDKTSTKHLEKQIWKNDQYNAFLPQVIIEQYEEMVDGNNLVIEAIECFYTLFVEAGVSEDEVKGIMENAAKKYSYSKRKGFQDILNIFTDYIWNLDVINKERHLKTGLNENETAIWLEYSNNRIKAELKEGLLLRERMREIANTEILEDLFVCDSNREYGSINQNIENEQTLFERCEKNGKIQLLLKKYKEILGTSISLKELVSLVFVTEIKESDETKIMIMKEVLNVPSDGNVFLTIEGTKEIREILLKLWRYVEAEQKNIAFDLRLKDRCERRPRDSELLQMAIKELQEERKKVKSWKKRARFNEIMPEIKENPFI